jgi:hypothetical protein
MDTGIRYFVIDPIEDCILTSTRDYRVAQATAIGILDSKVETLSDNSIKFQSAVIWSRDNWRKFDEVSIRLNDGSPTVIPDDHLSLDYKKRKSLAVGRKGTFTFLYLVADATLYGYFQDNFINQEAVHVLEEALTNENMLIEYASCVSLPVAEAEKEIRLKVESRKYSILKTQGHVDSLIKEINAANTREDILKMVEQIRFRLMGRAS